MKIKLALSAIALALLPCLPVKAEFVTVAFTKSGWWEVDTDSIEHLDNQIARFISRFMEDYQVDSLGADLVDCRRPRIMNIGLYNFDAQAWRSNHNPKWKPIKKGSA